MRTANDKRLWLDKADGVTTYGLYPDQRFYSVEYADSNDVVLAFREYVLEYNDWCKAAYVATREGVELPPFPVSLVDIVGRFSDPVEDNPIVSQELVNDYTLPDTTKG